MPEEVVEYYGKLSKEFQRDLLKKKTAETFDEISGETFEKKLIRNSFPMKFCGESSVR